MLHIPMARSLVGQMFRFAQHDKRLRSGVTGKASTWLIFYLTSLFESSMLVVAHGGAAVRKVFRAFTGRLLADMSYSAGAGPDCFRVLIE